MIVYFNPLGIKISNLNLLRPYKDTSSPSDHLQLFEKRAEANCKCHDGLGNYDPRFLFFVQCSVYYLSPSMQVVLLIVMPRPWLLLERVHPKG